MIAFFRKIRHTLLSGNKFSKYLLYAIGEIILVVIGILIALQIDNWNQERQNRTVKRDLLEKIYIEFQANRELIRDYKKESEMTMNAQFTLMGLLGSDRKTLERHNLDSLFYNSFQSYNLGLSDNSINSIVQSGQLNLFKNEPITSLFQEWNALSSIVDKRIEQSSEWNNDKFIPFLLPYISFKEMDSQSGYYWTGPSRIKPDYCPLFQRVEFENLLDNSMWLTQQVILRLEETEKLIEEILRESKNPI